MRCGLIAKKLGMTRTWGDKGDKQPVTVLHIDNLVVTGQRTVAQDGYNAVQLGAGLRKEKHTNKAQSVQYAKLAIAPRREVIEFPVLEENLIEVGKELSAEHFIVGQKIDARATSVGKGFAGAMKRHNFSGLRASHGVSISHRSHGSTGQNQDPGKVFKGKKMAGHMGARSVTTQNLDVVRVDAEKGLIFVKGAVPGPKNGWVQLRDAVKEAMPKDAPLPAGFKTDKVDAPVAEAELVSETA